MSNKCYILSINNTKDDKYIFHLNEYRYEIPMNFKILCSSPIKLVDSIMFKTKIPLCDFNIGLNRYIEYCKCMEDNISISNKSHVKSFIQTYSESITIMTRNKNKYKYLVLDATEIFEMDAPNLKYIHDKNKDLFNELLKINNQIKTGKLGFFSFSNTPKEVLQHYADIEKYYYTIDNVFDSFYFESYGKSKM